MPGVVVITGCSSGGIGHSLCEAFAAKGKVVYATARNVDKIGDFTSTNIHKLQLDVSSEESVQEAISTVVRKEGSIDIVVNNAGVLGIKPLLDLGEDQLKQVFDTNVFGVLRVVKAVAPSMVKRRSGLIINIGSVVGEVPTPWNGIYCSSKAALHSMTSTLRMELTPFNVNVMLVAPGAVKSNVANNQSQTFDVLPSNTLYSAFLPNIIERMNLSQGSNSMKTRVFADKVVGQALRRNPPGYYTLGGSSLIFRLLSWLPRWIVQWFMWRRFSKKM